MQSRKTPEKDGKSEVKSKAQEQKANSRSSVRVSHSNQTSTRPAQGAPLAFANQGTSTLDDENGWMSQKADKSRQNTQRHDRGASVAQRNVENGPISTYASKYRRGISASNTSARSSKSSNSFQPKLSQAFPKSKKDKHEDVSRHIQRYYALLLQTNSFEELCQWSQDFIQEFSKHSEMVHFTTGDEKPALAFRELIGQFINFVWQEMQDKDFNSIRHKQVDQTYHTKERYCVEAQLLQSLSQFRHPASFRLAGDTHNQSHDFYADVIFHLIARVAKYVKSFQVRKNIHKSDIMNHLQHTLGALVNTDLFCFPNRLTPKQIDNHRAANGLATDILNEVFKTNIQKLQLNQIKPMLGLLHWSLILNFPEAPLSDKAIKAFLARISEPNILAKFEYSKTNPNPIYLDKLNMIINFLDLSNKHDLVPENLREAVKALEKVKSENAHGSGFEKKVHSAISQELTELSKTYGHLISLEGLNASNPIMGGLGLEADMMYEYQGVRCCIQVDGNRYHKYNRTDYVPPSRHKEHDYGFHQASVIEGTNLKTLIRDKLFANRVTVCNYTDDTRLSENASLDIMANMIIPAYEIQEAQLQKLSFKQTLVSQERSEPDLTQAREIYEGIMREIDALVQKESKHKQLFEDICEAKGQEVLVEPKQISRDMGRYLEALGNTASKRQVMESVLQKIQDSDTTFDLNYRQRLKQLKEAIVENETQIDYINTCLRGLEFNLELKKDVALRAQSSQSDHEIQRLEGEIKKFETKKETVSNQIKDFQSKLDAMPEELKKPLLKRLFNAEVDLGPDAFYTEYEALLIEEQETHKQLLHTQTLASTHLDRLMQLNQQIEVKVKADRLLCCASSADSSQSSSAQDGAHPQTTAASAQSPRGNAILSQYPRASTRQGAPQGSHRPMRANAPAFTPNPKR